MSFSCYLLVSWRCCQVQSYFTFFMTRKHTTKKQQFWPGSNIPKSSGNAFDWHGNAQTIYSRAELAAMESGVRAKMSTSIRKSIPTYSKAKPSQFTNA